MAAPIMAVAKLIAGRRGQEKVHGFFRKLYKGRRGLGERLQKSGMKAETVLGRSGKQTLLVPKKDLFSKTKYYAGRGISGAKERLRPVGKLLKKHRRAYGWGVTGAAAWDILDND